MNSVIEFHDSKLVSVSRVGSDFVAHFQPAYVHKSEGMPGVEAGSGWIQEIKILIRDVVSTSSSGPELPWDLWGGYVQVGNQRHEGLVPIPFDARGTTELFLEFYEGMGGIRVTGLGCTVEVIGTATYVEEVPRQ